MYVVKTTGAIKQKPTRSRVGRINTGVLTMRNIADLKWVGQ